MVRAAKPRDGGTRASEGANDPERGKERPEGLCLSANTPLDQRAPIPYGRCIRSLEDMPPLCPAPATCQGTDGSQVGAAPRAALVASGRDASATRPSFLFAAGRTQVGARFIVHSSFGGRGEATPLPSAALRRPCFAACQRASRSPCGLSLTPLANWPTVQPVN